MSRFNNIMIVWRSDALETADVYIGETRIGVIGKIDPKLHPNKKTWGIAGLAFEIPGLPESRTKEKTPKTTYASWQDAVKGLFDWQFSDGLVFTEWQMTIFGEMKMRNKEDENNSSDYRLVQ